jgi:hypothetical protein
VPKKSSIQIHGSDPNFAIFRPPWLRPKLQIITRSRLKNPA